MEKEKVIIVVLILLAVVISVLAGVLYSKNIKLNADYGALTVEKNIAVEDVEKCRGDLQNMDLKLNMLQEDVNKIYRTCINENACKGHYPGVRWNCNNVGDETNINPSHICVCDSGCNLNATQVKQI